MVTVHICRRFVQRKRYFPTTARQSVLVRLSPPEVIPVIVIESPLRLKFFLFDALHDGPECLYFRNDKVQLLESKGYSFNRFTNQHYSAILKKSQHGRQPASENT